MKYKLIGTTQGNIDLLHKFQDMESKGYNPSTPIMELEGCNSIKKDIILYSGTFPNFVVSLEKLSKGMFLIKNIREITHSKYMTVVEYIDEDHLMFNPTELIELNKEYRRNRDKVRLAKIVTRNAWILSIIALSIFCTGLYFLIFKLL